MGMVVQHNMNAISAYNQVNANVAGLKKSSEKLSSGYRINRAGDDAAGLAISEKMRSQIKGLNQASRNAQDGISMIQTFEGAAEESHTILQRMKELATESANGTYDNSTDRAAIQLEFDQLNDELNQIADTDFNGTVVLNGGQMADGLKQSNNEFNYANKAAQVTADAKDVMTKYANGELSLSADKQAQLDDLIAQRATVEATSPIDIVSDTSKWNSVDDHQYDDAAAKQLWDDLGLDANVDKSVDVTFTVDSVDKDGNVTYKATSGTTKSGTALTDTQLANFKTTSKDPSTGLTGTGGFTVSAGGTDNVNAVFDATSVKAGDVVTLTFTAPSSGNVAPTNIGFEDNSVLATSDGTATGTAISGLDTTKAAVTLGAVKDADMTADVKTALDYFEGATISADITANSTGAAIAAFKRNGTAITVGADTTNKIFVAVAAGKLTVSTLNAAGNAADKTLFEVDFSGLGTAGSAGTISTKLAIDQYSVASASKPDVTAKASTADTAATTEKLAEIDSKILKAVGVSVSDAYDNSTAIMTYADNITLQVGSRTKDAVNFTFNYNADGTADMGDLKSNLNLSAREDGLNTASLSLANADDANYAIDQIDKAINKVSMVRATFGSIQNRLDYKIDNLTTTSTNLTEAESNIRDTDMASEMMNYTKYNILQQAAQSMLAQANQQPQSILQLLG
jgi:flagellin